MHETALLNEADTTRAERTTPRVVRHLIGLFLVSIALIKMAELFYSKPTISNFIMPKYTRETLAAFECLLGIWLITGIFRIWSYLTTVTVMSFFTLVNLYLIYRGFANCGCLGSMSASPKTMLLIDLILLIVSVAFPPVWTFGFRISSSILASTTVSLIAFAVVLTLIPLPSNMLVSEDGNWIIRDVSEVDRPVEHTFLMKNIGTKPIMIQDYHTDCGCTAIKTDQHVVPPLGHVAIPFRIASFSKEAMSYSQRAVLKTSDGIVTIGMSGKLPNNHSIRFRPQTIPLAFDAETQSWKSNLAELVIRTTKNQELQSAFVREDAVSVTASVVRMETIGDLNEYTINVTTKSGDPCKVNKLSLICQFDIEAIEIPINKIIE